ncbi:hypothetical protein F4780DRAFT_742430 [Xylariomycetidae sp. FL0641]|nr:hypothetical protein F4780DRAFT_742430 [Xylariomycetidae sp. FL0641]
MALADGAPQVPPPSTAEEESVPMLQSISPAIFLGAKQDLTRPPPRQPEHPWAQVQATLKALDEHAEGVRTNLRWMIMREQGRLRASVAPSSSSTPTTTPTTPTTPSLDARPAYGYLPRGSRKRRRHHVAARDMPLYSDEEFEKDVPRILRREPIPPEHEVLHADEEDDKITPSVLAWLPDQTPLGPVSGSVLPFQGKDPKGNKRKEIKGETLKWARYAITTLEAHASFVAGLKEEARRPPPSDDGTVPMDIDG